jgi:molybdopterin molybdotransferase
MLSLEQARERILDAVRPLPAETADLNQALGRFTAEPLRSTVDLPPADNSAMDGYAVRSED